MFFRSVNQGCAKSISFCFVYGCPVLVKWFLCMHCGNVLTYLVSFYFKINTKFETFFFPDQFKDTCLEGLVVCLNFVCLTRWKLEFQVYFVKSKAHVWEIINIIFYASFEMFKMVS